MITPQNRLADNFSLISTIIENLISQYDFDLRCAAPGIIQAFNKKEQTVTVQLSIKDIVYLQGKVEVKPIPELLDVPVVLPGGGNFVITMPIKKGDECLVVFADTCIDAWWGLGEEKDVASNRGARDPISIRRHDLSDGFAILRPSSKPKMIIDYNEDDLEIRTLDGKNKIQVKDNSIKISINDDTYIEIKDGEINIGSDSTVTLHNTGNMSIKSDTEVSVDAPSIKLGGIEALYKLIDERILTYYDAHTHLYSPGTGSSTPSGVPSVLLTPLASTIATTKVNGD